MASTNKTLNYDLSQYVGTDKPTYLGDYNNDMLKIDTAIKENADNIADINSDLETVTTTANQASSLASGASSTATQANTKANEANTRSLTNASNIEDINDFLTFGTSTHYTSGTLSVGSGSINSVDIYVNKSTDGKLAKIYGNLSVSANTNNSMEIEINTDFVVDEQFTVSPCGNYFANGLLRGGASIKFLTNGKIRIVINNPLANSNNIIYAIPFLIFIKNFGDAGE